MSCGGEMKKPGAMRSPVRVTDGIVDPDRWWKASVRVLWLLREVNDIRQTREGDGGGGLPATLRNSSRDMDANGVPTWGPVAKVTYGLLNLEQPWASWAHRTDIYHPTLRSIAVVNIKKTGGGAVSKWKELEKAYEANKVALLEQIREADPTS